jgi:hypothetical protein
MKASVVMDDVQIVWEQLNGILHDITNGNPADAVESVEDCIERMEKWIDKTEGESK